MAESEAARPKRAESEALFKGFACLTIVSLASVRYNVHMTETRNTRQDWLSVPRRREDERLDPHVYERGIDGLTVEGDTLTVPASADSPDRLGQICAAIVGSDLLPVANAEGVVNVVVADESGEQAECEFPPPPTPGSD